MNVLRGLQPNISSPSNDVTPVDIKGKGKATDEDESIDDILEDLEKDTFEPSAKMAQMIDLLKQCAYVSCFTESFANDWYYRERGDTR